MTLISEEQHKRKGHSDFKMHYLHVLFLKVLSRDIQAVTKKNYTFRKSYFWNFCQNTFSIIFSYSLRQRIKLLNKLYLMFIGALEAEIQAIVWRSRKMSWSNPVYFPPLCIRRDRSSVCVTMGKSGPSDFSMALGNGLYLDF